VSAPLSSALIGTLRSLRRATHCATGVVLAQKSVFNLRIDTMEPLFGALGSLLVGGDFRFQFRYSIFSPSKLMRKLLRRLQRVSAVLFRDAGCPVQHLQYCLACFVELISAVRRRGFFSPRKRNHFRLAVVTTDLTVHRSPLFLDFTNQIVDRIVMIVACGGFCTGSDGSTAFNMDLLRMSNAGIGRINKALPNRPE
jgi:hypothetical protein